MDVEPITNDKSRVGVPRRGPSRCTSRREALPVEAGHVRVQSRACFAWTSAQSILVHVGRRDVPSVGTAVCTVASAFGARGRCFNTLFFVIIKYVFPANVVTDWVRRRLAPGISVESSLMPPAWCRVPPPIPRISWISPSLCPSLANADAIQVLAPPSLLKTSHCLSVHNCSCQHCVLSADAIT